MINSVEVNNLLKKLKMFVTEENRVFNELNEQLRKIKSNYNTNNTINLENINFKLEKKFNIINKNYDININKLNEVLKGYQNTSEMVAASLEKLGETNGKFRT